MKIFSWKQTRDQPLWETSLSVGTCGLSPEICLCGKMEREPQGSGDYKAGAPIKLVEQWSPFTRYSLLLLRGFPEISGKYSNWSWPHTLVLRSYRIFFFLTNFTLVLFLFMLELWHGFLLLYITECHLPLMGYKIV